MNNIINILLLCVIFLTPGCSWKAVKIAKERKDIHKETQAMLNSDFSLEEKNEILLPQNISRNQAIGIALQNNPNLQAQFEELGIAKSDLIQAGLFSNPQLQSAFKLPHNKRAENTEIEIDLSINIADMWQVPLRKKVAHDKLEIKSLEILHAILTIFAETTMAYNHCISAQLQLNNAHKQLKTAQKLRDRIYYRKEFGYTNDIDASLADTMLKKHQQNIVLWEQNIINTHIKLKNLLGLDATPKLLKLNDKLPQTTPSLSLENLIEYALTYRPEMEIAYMKVQKAKDKLALEKSRFIKDFNVGVSYKKDFGNEKGLGPAFGISVPVFDTNHAQVKRARAIILRAEKELEAQRILIIKEINHYYNDFIAAQKQLELIEQMIPSYEHAHEYAKTYFAMMQITKLTVYETKLAIYETQSHVIDAHLNVLNSLSHLEKAVGKKIE